MQFYKLKKGPREITYLKIRTVFLSPRSYSTLSDKARSQERYQGPSCRHRNAICCSTPGWARHIQTGVGSSVITTEWFKSIWDSDSKQQQLQLYGWRHPEDSCRWHWEPELLLMSKLSADGQKRQITGSSHSKQGGPFYLNLPRKGLCFKLPWPVYVL